MQDRSTHIANTTKPASVWELFKRLAANKDIQPQPESVRPSNDAALKAAQPTPSSEDTVIGISSARLRGMKLAESRPMVEHEGYMSTAAELALTNPSQPFAALLVDRSTGEILAHGVNSTNSNPLFHGEIACINNAAQSFSRFDWRNTTLYTTAEPCCMCQAAILWCRIRHVVFGTSVATLRSLGWDQFSMDATGVVNAAPFADCDLTGGVLADRCNALFQVAAEIRTSRLSSLSAAT